jgi:hypothetical protein
MQEAFISSQLKNGYKKITSHPLYKYISSHGDFDYLDSCITNEIKNDTSIILDTIIITDNWIISLSPNLNIIHLSDIVWVYKEIYTNRYSFNNPVTYLIIIKSKNNRAVSFTSNIEFIAEESDIDTAMEILANKIGHVFFGYSEELNELWDDDKKKFIELVEKAKLSSSKSL